MVKLPKAGASGKVVSLCIVSLDPLLKTGACRARFGHAIPYHPRSVVAIPKDPAFLLCDYGIGKYLVNRLNIKGMEITEKMKLDRIN